MLVGFELPNRPEVTADDWRRADLLPLRAAKLRAYHVLSSHGPTNLRELAKRTPLVILRPNEDGPVWDADQRATALFSCVMTLNAHGLHDIIIVPDNEPNHVSHGFTAPPSDYWARVHSLASGLRARGARVRVASPPLAVAQGERAWLDAGVSVIRSLDLFAAHLYGQLDTSLADATLGLYRAYGAGRPLLIDELGDSHPTAGWERKADSIRTMLSMAAQAGAVAATIFMLGDNGDWRSFVPPDEVIPQLAPTAAPAAIKEASMPKQTTMTLTELTEPITAGGRFECGGRFDGWDGGGGYMVTFVYPPKADQTAWATDQPSIPLLIEPDGRFRFWMQLLSKPEFGGPFLNCTLRFNTVELDPGSPLPGDEIWDGAQFEWPVLLRPAAYQAPAVSPPVVVIAPQPVVAQAALPLQYHLAFGKIGDVINLLGEVDPVYGEGGIGREALLDHHRHIMALKGEDIADPFASPRRPRR
jgi:hypothetical protein